MDSAFLGRPREILVRRLWSASLLLSACSNQVDLTHFAGDYVYVHAEITGSGRLYAPDPVVGLDCHNDVQEKPSYSCREVKFLDAGGGGTFDVVAEPDPGWQVAEWDGSCTGTLGLVCILSFVDAPVSFHPVVIFVDTSAIVLSDDFEPDCSKWQATVSITSTSGSGSASESCQASGGSDGGRYRQMTHQLDGQGNLVVDHEFTGATVEVGPAGGSAICAASVRFEEQRRVVTAAFTGAGVGAGVWVIQGGTRYRATSAAFTNTDWDAFDSGPLTASDFTPTGLDLCPAVATELTFGFSRSNTNTSTGTQVMVHGIDEWKVTIAPK